MGEKYNVLIGTYVHRFEEYLKPLMQDVSKNRPDINKIIFVNGQHKEEFSEDYRREMLVFLSQFKNTYVHMSPCFRGCSYIWNTGINMCTEENLLFIADDNSISDDFFPEYEKVLNSEGTGSFSIGPSVSFSHFSVTREDIKNIGYFDERLLAIGEEDGDWDFRYSEYYSVPENRHFGLPHFQTNSIRHYCENSDNTSRNIKKCIEKYSAFNRELTFSTIINEEPSTHDPEKFTRQGPYGCPVQRREDESYGKSLYPGQLFFWENNHLL